MNKHTFAGGTLACPPANLHQRCRLAASRIAVVAAILVFVATYLYGISTFGAIAGIAFGWLPSGLAAWLTAVAVASAGMLLIRLIITTRRHLSPDPAK